MTNLIVAIILGAFASMGFFYPTLQLLVPTVFIIFTMTTVNNKSIFGFFSSFHTIGSMWLLVPIHYIGGLNYMLSLMVISLLGIFFGLIYSLSYRLTSVFKSNNSLLTFMLLPTAIMISEFIKLHILGGYPFLIFGYFFATSSFSFIIPFLGIYGCTFIFVFACSFIGKSIKNKNIVKLIIILFFIVISELIEIKPPLFYKHFKPLSIYVVHTNKHYLTEKNVIKSKAKPEILNKSVDLILYPEAMYGQLDNIKTNSKSTYILTGLIFHDDQKKGSYNSMIGINKNNQIDYLHKKHHLAQFNEWIPSSIQHLLKLLELPHQGFIAGNGTDTNGAINDINFMGLICYELLFSSFIYQHIDDANVILSNNDLGWFENSLFENHFNQIAQFMALLTQKPIIISSNVGQSMYIKANGEISHFKNNQVIITNTNEGKTPWMYYGDNTILFLILMFYGIIFLATRNHD
ncbi:MAG: nitrilase-related carbon-nitrogen hydrolase [Pseudomonadota bacterium]|nr:nitrilase-related carbon-nitrogen hydrolase [Pseudomonadota bacterium]